MSSRSTIGGLEFGIIVRGWHQLCDRLIAYHSCRRDQREPIAPTSSGRLQQFVMERQRLIHSQTGLLNDVLAPVPDKYHAAIIPTRDADIHRPPLGDFAGTVA